ncbi:hypothetical protein HDK77DRAFT_476133 [Phyllosticta capitalensis]
MVLTRFSTAKASRSSAVPQTWTIKHSHEKPREKPKETSHKNLQDNPQSKPEHTSSVRRDDVAWNDDLNREALPMSSQDYEAVPSETYKCVCGMETYDANSTLIKGKMTASEISLAPKPLPTFNQHLGSFEVPGLPAVGKGFVRLDVSEAANKPHARKTQQTILAPDDYTVEQYIENDYKAPELSYERTVPRCEHFLPTEELIDNAIVFKSGGRRTTNHLGHEVDQARYLCLIADETEKNRRRLTVHSPPSDWANVEQVSALNRWKSQFRLRKLGLGTRAYREPWSKDQLQFLLDYLVENGASYQRENLAELVNGRFGLDRTGHSVTCAIDNHKLRNQANKEIQRRREKLEADAVAGLVAAAAAAAEQHETTVDGKVEVDIKEGDVEVDARAMLADYGWTGGDSSDEA